MRREIMLVAGMAAGGAIMYFLDPERGNRRRAIVRDQVTETAKTTSRAIGKTSRDMVNRTGGLVAETKSLFADGEASDDAVEERVRSKLGRLTKHPGSIEVSAQGGTVTLSGPVLASDVKHLLSGVSSAKGVKEVRNRLQVYEAPSDVPGLQGQPKQRGEQFEFFQRNWSPVARVLAALVGAGLAFYGLRKRDVLGSSVAGMGVGLMTRGLTSFETERMLGIGAGRNAIELQKGINIDAPIEQVFRTWSLYENFPRFMSNVREVRSIGKDKSHWEVAGPLGATVQWDAVVTKYEPNKVIAWKTVPGSPVEHSGIVTFWENPDGSTHADVRLSYNPVAGGLGHVLTSLPGGDPKKRMDEDLMRMKSFIETGKVPSDATAGRS